jgi:hypothetical protein
MHVRFGSSIAALALLFIATPAAARQPDATEPPATPSSTPGPNANANGAEPKVPSLSLAIERVGGIGYAKAAASEGDSSLSLVALGVGGVTPNPFAVPRVGVDFILGSGLTLGGAVGFTHISASAGEKNTSQDLGSVTLYTLTPRVGYRIPLSEHIDLTPRAGLTFAGASFSPADKSSGSSSIFALAIGADAPLAFRLTDSFNLLAGVGIDYTVSATVSTESSSTTVTTGPGGTGTTTSKSTSTEDVKGTLFSMQGWIGIGGYL